MVLKVKATFAQLRRERRCSKQHCLPNSKRIKVCLWMLDKVTVWGCFVSHVPCLLWWEWSDSAALSNRTSSASDTRPLKNHQQHTILSTVFCVLYKFCFAFVSSTNAEISLPDKKMVNKRSFLKHPPWSCFLMSKLMLILQWGICCLLEAPLTFGSL